MKYLLLALLLLAPTANAQYTLIGAADTAVVDLATGATVLSETLTTGSQVLATVHLGDDTNGLTAGATTFTAHLEYDNVPFGMVVQVGPTITWVKGSSLSSGVELGPFLAESGVYRVVVSSDDASDTTVYSFGRFLDTDPSLEKTNTDGHSTLSSLVESSRYIHQYQPQGSIFYVAPNTGDTWANGARGAITDPFNSVQDCLDNAVSSSDHDVIFLVADGAGSVTTLDEQVTISKSFVSIRGPGPGFDWKTTSNGDTITVTGDGVSLEGFQLNTHTTGAGKGIVATGADFLGVRHLWVNDTRSDGIQLTNCSNYILNLNHFKDTGTQGSGECIHVIADTGVSDSGSICFNTLINSPGNAIHLSTAGGSVIQDSFIHHNNIFNSGGSAILLADSGVTRTVLQSNTFVGNATDNNTASSTDTTIISTPSVEAIAVGTQAELVIYDAVTREEATEDKAEIITRGNTAWITSVDTGVAAGAALLRGTLSRRNYYDQEYIEIVQGESKTLTFIVEPVAGLFASATPIDITVRFVDPAGVVVDIVNADIVRVTEASDIQVFRAALTTAQTQAMTKGVIKIETTIDSQKAQFLDTLKIVEGL